MVASAVWRRAPSGSCFSGWGTHPRAAPSQATMSAVWRGGRANGDERRAARTLSWGGGGGTPSRRFLSLGRDGGGVLQDVVHMENLTRPLGGEGAAVPLPGKLQCVRHP
uniref:Uncharacterized protein n=1 Tax=Oryza punctata TaxID=4537 RepID=A0A0E0LBF5_ORYPU